MKIEERPDIIDGKWMGNLATLKQFPDTPRPEAKEGEVFVYLRTGLVLTLDSNDGSKNPLFRRLDGEWKGYRHWDNLAPLPPLAEEPKAETKESPVKIEGRPDIVNGKWTGDTRTLNRFPLGPRPEAKNGELFVSPKTGLVLTLVLNDKSINPMFIALSEGLEKWVSWRDLAPLPPLAEEPHQNIPRTTIFAKPREAPSEYMVVIEGGQCTTVLHHTYEVAEEECIRILSKGNWPHNSPVRGYVLAIKAEFVSEAKREIRRKV